MTKGVSISTIDNPLASCSLINEKLSINKLQLKTLLNKTASRNCNQNHFRIKLSLKYCSIVEKSQLKPLQNKINSRELFYCPEIAIKNQFWTKTHFTFWQKNYSSVFCLYNSVLFLHFKQYENSFINRLKSSINCLSLFLTLLSVELFLSLLSYCHIFLAYY